MHCHVAIKYNFLQQINFLSGTTTISFGAITCGRISGKSISPDTINKGFTIYCVFPTTSSTSHVAIKLSIFPTRTAASKFAFSTSYSCHSPCGSPNYSSKQSIDARHKVTSKFVQIISLSQHKSSFITLSMLSYHIVSKQCTQQVCVDTCVQILKPSIIIIFYVETHCQTSEYSTFTFNSTHISTRYFYEIFLFHSILRNLCFITARGDE